MLCVGKHIDWLIDDSTIPYIFDGRQVLERRELFNTHSRLLANFPVRLGRGVRVATRAIVFEDRECLVGFLSTCSSVERLVAGSCVVCAVVVVDGRAEHRVDVAPRDLRVDGAVFVVQ